MDINKIHNIDVLEGLMRLDDNSVDCVVTSPPYWALRDYGVAGQLGLEPTFQEYIQKLTIIFNEVKRVLKKEGTCWVNLGDTYWGGGNKRGCSEETLSEKQFSNRGARGQVQVEWTKDYQSKSLCLIPFRLAIAMQESGWIVRNDIVWYKRNSMPSSVKDRFANKWEHVFLMVKSKKYHFNLDAIRKAHKPSSVNRINAGFSDKVSFNYRVREALKGTLEPKFGDRYNATEEEKKKYSENKALGEPRARKQDLVGKRTYTGFNERYKEKYNQLTDKAYQRKVLGVPHDSANIHPLGGNPGDFWDLTTEPHPFAHFAVFPEKLVMPCIKAGCPEGGLVLDPFMGSGTTAVVARKLSRNFIGFELNPEYIKIAESRLDPLMEQKKLDEVGACT